MPPFSLGGTRVCYRLVLILVMGHGMGVYNTFIHPQKYCFSGRWDRYLFMRSYRNRFVFDALGIDRYVAFMRFSQSLKYVFGGRWDLRYDTFFAYILQSEESLFLGGEGGIKLLLSDRNF